MTKNKNSKQNTKPWDRIEPLVISEHPSDAGIDAYSRIPGPNEVPYYYTEEWQKKTTEKARLNGRIILYHLVFILAKEERYAEILPKLWDLSGLDDKLFKLDPSILESEEDCANIWYWILCSWAFSSALRFKHTIQEGAVEITQKSSYFSNLQYPPPGLLPYHYFNNELMRTKHDEECSPNDCFVKLDEFKNILNDIRRTCQLSLTLPAVLFPETNGENITGDTTDKSEGKQEEIPKEKILKCGPGTKWKDIHITLISDDTVEIKTPSDKERFGYQKLGLRGNREDGKPKKLWAYLTCFAKAQGVISAKTFDDPELKKDLITYASKLNKYLQGLFGINESIYKGHYKKKMRYDTKIMFSDATQIVGTKTKNKEQSKSEEIGEMFQKFEEHEKF